MRRLGVSIGLGLFFALILNILSPQTALAVSCGTNKSHNAFFGRRHPRDELLYMARIKTESKWFRVVTEDVYFPGKYDRPGNITYVEIYDQFRNGTGGCALVTSGGVGSSHIAIHLKSQRGSGLDFIIRIYGIRVLYGNGLYGNAFYGKK